MGKGRYWLIAVALGLSLVSCAIDFTGSKPRVSPYNSQTDSSPTTTTATTTTSASSSSASPSAMMMSAALGSNPLASPALSKLLGRLLDGMSAVDEQTGKANQAKFAHPITSLLVSGNQISVRAQIVSTKPIAAGTVIQMLAFDPQATDEKDLWLGVAGEGTVDAQGVLNMQVQKPDLGWMRPTELVVPR